MPTIKQKALNTLNRVETQVVDIARDHIALLRYANPNVWHRKDLKDLEDMIYSAIRIIRMDIMNNHKIHGGQSFSYCCACLNVTIHCYSQERPSINVSVTPNCKCYN